MGVKTNDRPVEPPKDIPNGHVIATKPSPSAQTKALSLPKRALGLVARYASTNVHLMQKVVVTAWLIFDVYRLLVWYTVFVAAFQCPVSLDNITEQSSVVCKPYLTIRSHVSPYLEPYYDAYAAPYVDAARPYIGKLDKHVYSPAVGFGKHSYAVYGAPRVNQARQFGQAQWEQTVKPQIDAAQAQAKASYDASLGPHVSKASSASAPYYTAGRDNVLQIYKSMVIPAYAASRPYMEKSYSLGHKVLVETGLPTAQWLWGSSVVFMDRTLWPKLRILYGENVEPQLMRIGERLGRYRDGKKLMAAVREVDR